MLYIFKSTGDIVRVVPDRVYQGSTDANKILLLAPFASNLTAEVVFQLPDGQTTIPFPLQYIGKMQENLPDSMQSAMHAWQTQLPIAVTQNYGEVQVQFYFTSTQNQKITTPVTSFIVERGLISTLPEQPTEDIYNTLKSNIATLQADLVNAFYSAKSIYAWNSTYTYGANEITFFPSGKYGAFVQSLVSNNQNIPIVDGILDENWKLVISFDNIADSYFEEVKQIALEAKGELVAVQQAIANLKSIENSILVYVDALPKKGEANKIYAVLSSKSSHLFTLYIWLNTWHCLGEKYIEGLTTLPKGAVLYLSQKLSETEMAQARQNINAQEKGDYILQTEMEQILEEQVKEKLQEHLKDSIQESLQGSMQEFLEQELSNAIETQLKDYVTAENLENKLTENGEQLQRIIDNKIESVGQEVQNKILTQRAEILVEVDGKLGEIESSLQENIQNLSQEIESLQAELSAMGSSGGSTSLSGSVGSVGEPIYLQNGEIKACENIKAEDGAVVLLSNSVCENVGRNKNILVGSHISGRGIREKCILIGTEICCSGENLLGIGTGDVVGEYSLSVGMGNSVVGDFCVAIGACAIAEGEMSCAIGPCAYSNEDFSIVFGSEENKNLYYYGSLQSKSDARDKADIEALDKKKSLQFINALKTVTYVNNDRGKYRDKNSKRAKGVGSYDKAAHKAGTKKGTRRQIGVLAQDVELQMQKVYRKELANLVNDNLYHDAPLSKNDNCESQKFVNYIGFIPLLISAMQAQQQEIQKLKKAVQNLKKES